MRGLLVAILATLSLACRSHPRTLAEPEFTTGEWRIRLQADSTPSRKLQHTPVTGSIDFAANVAHIDYRPLVGRQLSPHAEVRIEKDSSSTPPSTIYRIILGELNSDVGKIALVAHAIRPDSLAGTWSETVLCCSAVGTFVLWRVHR